MVSIFSPNGAEIPIWFEATQIFNLLGLHPTSRLHKRQGFTGSATLLTYTLTNTLHHFGFLGTATTVYVFSWFVNVSLGYLIHANLVAPTSKPPLTCDWLSCTCRMFAATGWKFEYIFREMRFQSAGEMTYKPGPKLKERSAHVLLVGEGNRYTGRTVQTRRHNLASWTLVTVTKYKSIMTIHNIT